MDDLRRQLERKTQRTASASAREIETRLKRTGPFVSGNMNANTTARSRATTAGAAIDVEVNTPYAHIVARGQRPHVIEPRRDGGVLVFDVGGRTVYARSVNHPGAQGNDWWTSTIRDSRDILLRNWRGAR
jgi:hypothetical protein